MNDHNHLIHVIRFFWKKRRDNNCFISWMEDNGHLKPSPEPTTMLMYTGDDGIDTPVGHMQDDYNAAINYALDELDNAQDARAFLEAWREGDWGTLDEEFPDFDLTDRLRNPQL